MRGARRARDRHRQARRSVELAARHSRRCRPARSASSAATGRRPSLAADLIVLSPGVPEMPGARGGARRGRVAITGELELASRFVSSTLVAITGTNGKSTTTTLCGDMVRATGRPTFVGGNLGDPLAEAVGTRAAARRAASASSRRRASSSRPWRRSIPASRCCSTSPPDHLDRYPDLEGYAAAKARIFAAQTRGRLRGRQRRRPAARCARAEGIGGVRVRLLRRAAARRGRLRGRRDAVRAAAGRRPRTLPGQLPGLVGRHNQENALAALLAGRLAGATAERGAARAARVPAACRTAWSWSPRRAASSTTTTPRAPTSARWWRRWTAFRGRWCSIAGGRDKGGDYAPLAAALAPGGARRGADRRGRRPDRRRARRRAARSSARHHGRGGRGGRPARPRPATRWCCRPPARASTCSATTPTEPRCSAPPSTAWPARRSRYESGAAALPVGGRRAPRPPRSRRAARPSAGEAAGWWRARERFGRPCKLASGSSSTPSRPRVPRRRSARARWASTGCWSARCWRWPRSATVMVFSSGAVFAAKKYGDATYFLKRELVYAILGLGAFSLATAHRLRRLPARSPTRCCSSASSAAGGGAEDGLARGRRHPLVPPRPAVVPAGRAGQVRALRLPRVAARAQGGEGARVLGRLPAAAAGDRRA